VVFGHSILPQFFDPKNYMSIFSTLPTIKQGDEILVYFDGITYKYIVRDMFEVRPDDIQILEQNTSGSYLTLVTCTPPGHPLKPKRLIVRAKLADDELHADAKLR
jgi:sortase A